jgi:AraC-like DNA-binding protein
VRTLTELAERITALSARDQSSPLLPGLVVSCDDLARDTVSVTRPMLAIVAQGAKRTMSAGRVYDYHAGQYLISTMDLPVTGKIIEASPARPFLGVGVPLDESIIAQLALETGPDRPIDDTEAGIVVADADDELIDAVVRLLRLLDRPREFAVLGVGVEREIHWRLMNGPHAALVRKIGRSDSRVSIVRRAARWIIDHYDRTIRIAEVADHVGVSEATLNRHFRAITAMSPLQYQKQIRLGRARVQLMNAPDDIAGVGHSVGYDSPSQFNREYRRMYGVPPGQDAVRLQQGTLSYETV